MNQHVNRTPLLRRNILAGIFPLVCVATAANAVAAPGTPCACNGAVYSVINLDPEGAIHFLNERGQAAVGSFVYGTNSFFDGNRVVPLGSLDPSGRGGTTIRGLNNLGVVTGNADDNVAPYGDFYHFTWTAARGMRSLRGSLPGQVWGINDRNQIVAEASVPGIVGRAVRYEPNGGVTPLGPMPVELSSGRAINDRGFTGGYTDHPDGRLHATVWNAAGGLTDLGTLGGFGAVTLFVNERGEAAGNSDDAANENEAGFFWSRATGMVPTGTRNAGSRTVADLNDRGEVVGDTETAGIMTAYQWSRARGLMPLPRAGAAATDVFDINNRGEMAGAMQRAGAWRAALWRGLTAPVDLNTRLHRLPAGLVLSHAVAVNDAGTILAASNAGLVMLRPGTKGTDAPVLGPVTGLPESVTVGDEVRASLGFIDNAPGQVHTATVDWGDSCASPAPLVREAWGRGEVGLQHRFCEPGFRTIALRLTDSGGRSTEVRTQVLVNAPGLAAVGGRGKLAGPGAGGAQPLAFTLWAPLGDSQAAPAAVTLQGPFGFRSNSVTAARSGAQVKLEGTGRYNGRPGYRFVVDGTDGGQGGADRMRVRISHRSPEGAEVVDYDSAAKMTVDAKAGAPASKAASATVGAADGMREVEGALVLSN